MFFQITILYFSVDVTNKGAREIFSCHLYRSC